MADDNVAEVKISANTAKAKAGLDQVSQATREAMGKMGDSLNGFKNKVASFHSDVQSHFTSLTNILKDCGEAAMALGAIMAGGALFKSAIDTYVNMNAEAKKLSVVMGQTIGDAQALLETFQKFGVSGEAAEKSMMMLTRQLKTNEQGFNDNGIATRDSDDNLLSMNEILFNSVDRLKEMKAGTERNMLATMLFGRSVANMPGFLKMSQEAVNEMKNHLASLGLTLDDVSVAKARAFQEGMHDVNLVFDALKYKIAAEVIPIFIRMGKWFSGEGKAVVSAFVATIRGLANACAFLATQAAKAFENFNSLGNASGPKGGGGGGGWGTEEGDPVPGGGGGGDDFVGKDKGGKGGKGGGAGSIVQEWQNELDQMKLANKSFQDNTLEMEKNFWSQKLAQGKTATKSEEEQLKASEKEAEKARLQQEQNFWKEKLAACNEGSKEYIEVQHKVVLLEGQINKSRIQSDLDVVKAKIAANQEATKSQEEALTHQQQLDKIDLAMKRENVNYLSQLGKVNKAQELQAYRTLLLQEQALDLQDEQKKVALYAGDEKKYQEHIRKLALLKKQQQLDIQKVNNQIAVAEAGTWEKIFNTMESSFTSAIGQMLSGTQSFISIIGSLFKSMVTGLVNMFLQMGLEWAKTLLFQTTSSKTAAVGSITDSAAQAFSAAWASTAAIPIVGPALAPAMAATSYAGALSGLSMLAYETGAWNIPSKQVAMLHPGEMIMPAEPAEQFRKGGGSGGGGMTINIHATDADSVVNLFKRNGRALADTIREQVRNNVRF